MPGHELGASYKPVKKRWAGKVEYPITEAYKSGHEATFGVKADPFCPGCGARKAWCECALNKLSAIPDLHNLADRVRAAR